MPPPPPSCLISSMTTALTNRQKKSILRSLRIQPPDLTDFSSNDFLSLSTSPLLRHIYLSSLNDTAPSAFRLGSGGSRLLDGNSSYAEQLEAQIAEFHRGKTALLFNSGFDANSGFFACVPQKNDVVIHDSLIHASVREGIKLSRVGSVCAFAHNSVVDLKSVLTNFVQHDVGVAQGSRNVFVAVEALYSMDGDVAPLREMVDALEQTLPQGNGYLIVDEAHSNGVFGYKGRGIVCSLGLEDRIFARLHTFGKALACNGAAMICDPLVKEYLINYAKPLMYTTSMSFPSLVAINSVYTLMRHGTTEPLIVRLNEHIEYLFDQLNLIRPLTTHPHNGTSLLILPPQKPNSPIFSLLTSQPRSLAASCESNGFVVRPIMPPTVPLGTERIRICLHAGNTRDQIKSLVQCVKLWLEKERRKETVGVHEQQLFFKSAL
ncbi:8-amino-7-oxononanoate synthase [Podosphaera aphanis]|nr:8-amino-7-oxononanoate synthase [Podosphaera aphanis]